MWNSSSSERKASVSIASNYNEGGGTVRSVILTGYQFLHLSWGQFSAALEVVREVLVW